MPFPTTLYTISDFKLTTPGGILIAPVTTSDPCYRLCCKDDVVASWVVLNTASDCSDNSNVGSISITGAHGKASYTLQKNTSDHRFCFCVCDTGQYTLNFHRQCSDGFSDDFSFCLNRFKTTVNAGSDQSILFGATAILGSDAPNSDTTYHWTSSLSSDKISDANSLNATARPCKPGSRVYTVKAQDKQFSDCSDIKSIHITVKTPIITWSDAQQSDGGDTCTFSACLISSDTYTNSFHITLKNLTTGSDIVNFFSDAPFCFTQTVNKPIVPGTTQYRLTAALSDFEDCSNAIIDKTFSCTKAQAVLPAGPSTFEMLFRVFLFLLAFILLGLTLDNNM